MANNNSYNKTANIYVKKQSFTRLVRPIRNKQQKLICCQIVWCCLTLQLIEAAIMLNMVIILVLIVLIYFPYIVYHFDMCHCLLHSSTYWQNTMQSMCVIIQFLWLGLLSSALGIPSHSGFHTKNAHYTPDSLILPKLILSLQLFSYRRCR
jgi:hypothetical protein